MYNDQDSLLKDLNKCVEYEKTIEFFIKCKGLHSYFKRKGGSFLDVAKTNAKHSMDEKAKSGRDYTYSELEMLINEIKMLERK